MSRVALYLLGPPQVEMGGEPLHIGRRKALALLAYLAVEPRRHSRDALATLLWPEYNQREARTDLRRTLSVLSRALGQELLTSDRETVGLRQAPSANSGQDQPEGQGHTLWLDVDAFRQWLAACEAHGHPAHDTCPDCLNLLTEAVELYRDDFLSGFSLPDSPAFDDWQRYQTQGLRDELASALERLADCHSAAGAVEPALAAARRRLELDPLGEAAHRQLMALYAQAGRRTAALRQYRECVRVLEQELGLPPAAQTTALYERIQAQRRAREETIPSITPPLLQPGAVLPAFLLDEEAPRATGRPVFVARERELAQLKRHLETALAGHGCVVFITGGPGRGKTTLMAEFARRAMEAHPELLVASGVCNAYSGVGDAYLPFREALGMLTGDVEALWSAGAVSSAHARRMWEAIPLASRALLDHGPFLIDALVPGPALLSRATACASASDDDGWLDQLRAWVEREKGEHSDLEQSALFTQLTNVLATLSVAHPLLLLLDDLQWADGGSTGLLFHLGRRLGNARILIVGAYRPEEVAIVRDGAPHALQELLSEFRRLYGEVTLDLSQADAEEGRRFVDSLLDAEPNRLSADFRATLHRHAGGHPLFTVELLRIMQERGDLVQDGEGLWIESEALDWATLPARVEAVIEKRVARLDPDLRDLLTVASVEGERFTAQVVAQVQDKPARDVLWALSQELGSSRHRLVREEGEERVDEHFLSRYRFTHALFQEYLYQTLSAGERRLLHGGVAATLEALYGDQSAEIAVQLAHHYTEAGHEEKAVEFSLRAGDQARLSYANQEAITYYQQALELLSTSRLSISRQDWRLEALRRLGEVYYRIGEVKEAEKHLQAAIALGKEIGVASRELVHLLWWLGEALFWQSRGVEVIPIAEEGLALMGQDTETLEAAMMNVHFAVAHLHKGDKAVFREFTERTAEFIERLPYTEQLRFAFINIVVRYKLDKAVEEAIKWLEILKKKATPRHDLKALGEVCLSTANNSRFRGDWYGAIAHYRQALGYFAKIGDAKRKNTCELAFGEVHLALGDLQNAEAYAFSGFESQAGTGRRDEIAWRFELISQIALCQGFFDKAADALEKAIPIRQEMGVNLREGWASLYLGRVYLAQGDKGEATRLFKEAVTLLGSDTRWQSAFVQANALSGLEEACQGPEAFRILCRRFREAHPKIREALLVNWYLEPTEPIEFARSLDHDEFVGPLSPDWWWDDPFDDCSYAFQNGFEVHAANGRDLWHVNLSAPRLLRPAPADEFSVQTLCAPAEANRPAIGGLLLWQDKENYLRLDRGSRGPHEISFQGCIGNQDLIIGRGQLALDASGRVFLRLERIDDRVHTLCSADGEAWFSVGQIDFATAGPLQIGLHAIGMIDRTIYHGAYPDGTAIRFESFTLWGM